MSVITNLFIQPIYFFASMIIVSSSIVTKQWSNGKQQQQSNIWSYRGESWVYKNESIFISCSTTKFVVVLFNPVKISEQYCPELWSDAVKSYLTTQNVSILSIHSLSRYPFSQIYVSSTAHHLWFIVHWTSWLNFAKDKTSLSQIDI